jgi:hypothetical protein
MTHVRILKAHSHSMSGSLIWASLECHCCFWIAEGLVSYLIQWLLTLQLFENSNDTEEKLRLNLHSLSVSVSELLEYGRQCLTLSTDWVFNTESVELIYPLKSQCIKFTLRPNFHQQNHSTRLVLSSEMPKSYSNLILIHLKLASPTWV